MRLIEVEQVLELLVERDAQDERQLRGGVEQARFDGGDGLARHAHEARVVGLLQARFGTVRLQAVLELELAVFAVDIVDPEGGKLHHGRPYIVPKRYLIANVTAPNAAKRPQTKLNFILNW